MAALEQKIEEVKRMNKPLLKRDRKASCSLIDQGQLFRLPQSKTEVSINMLYLAFVYELDGSEVVQKYHKNNKNFCSFSYQYCDPNEKSS